MQTFLPYADFTASAICLDRQRLGKQRVECLQILITLTHGSRWENHPAVRMWRGFEDVLIRYGLAVCREWKRRGYRDTCKGKITQFREVYPDSPKGLKPKFLGNTLFHSSHRAALLFKNPDWYTQFEWLEPPAVPDAKGSLPYVWPV